MKLYVGLRTSTLTNCQLFSHLRGPSVKNKKIFVYGTIFFKIAHRVWNVKKDTFCWWLFFLLFQNETTQKISKKKWCSLLHSIEHLTAKKFIRQIFQFPSRFWDISVFCIFYKNSTFSLSFFKTASKSQELNRISKIRLTNL